MYDDREPDGTVHYRHDELGARVAVLPATCKVGVHSLHRSGYRALVRDGVLYLSCTPCAEDIDVDHFWGLRTVRPDPARAELDDAPYRGVVPNMVVPWEARAEG